MEASLKIRKNHENRRRDGTYAVSQSPRLLRHCRFVLKQPRNPSRHNNTTVFEGTFSAPVSHSTYLSDAARIYPLHQGKCWLTSGSLIINVSLADAPTFVGLRQFASQFCKHSGLQVGDTSCFRLRVYLPAQSRQRWTVRVVVIA